MAKLVILIISIWILDAARTFPVIAENNQDTDFSFNNQTKNRLNEDRNITLNDSEKVPSAFVHNNIQTPFSQQPVRSGRRKRGIINGGGCPAGQVWKPRPFYCITCEDYERLSGNDCSE